MISIYNLPLSPPPYSFFPFFPSLISLMVSVDVKHHVCYSARNSFGSSLLGSGCKIHATWSSQCTRCCSSNSDAMGRGGRGIILYYSALIPNSLRIFDMLCQNSDCDQASGTAFPILARETRCFDFDFLARSDFFFLFKKIYGRDGRHREGLEPQPHAVSGSNYIIIL